MWISLKNKCFQAENSATLAVFRLFFGALLFFSTLRFMAYGWVDTQYVAPLFHFKYYGFYWVKAMSETGMYAVFVLMAITAIMIAIGLWYRWAMIAYFILFSYVELVDITYYLNHYYFISLMCFIMCFLPASDYFSVDSYRNPESERKTIPAWTIYIIKLQLGIVYFYAGIAKLNPDWLFDAMPLSIWLQSKSDWPILGTFFTQKWMAYFFSWSGALFDLCIPFLLFNRKTRIPAYALVVFFHFITWMMFPIGMFPWIMMCITWVFFDASVHEKIIAVISKVLPQKKNNIHTGLSSVKTSPKWENRVLLCGLLFFGFQLLFPFRYALYPGKLFWTEQGFRFSWRVMLIEKAGTAFFYVTNPETGVKVEIDNSDFLTPLQEKMMATQPDLLLQYAQIIEKEVGKRGLRNPKITAEVYVTLNGRRSHLFIDPEIDLTKLEDSFAHKTWILPYDDAQH